MTDLMADIFDDNKHPMVNRASFPKFVKVEGGEALKLHACYRFERAALPGNVLSLTVAV